MFVYVTCYVIKPRLARGEASGGVPCCVRLPLGFLRTLSCWGASHSDVFLHTCTSSSSGENTEELRSPVHVWKQLSRDLQDFIFIFMPHMLRPCEHNIEKTPWENFFKFGTNVQLHSSMDWLEFFGWRSEAKVTVTPTTHILDLVNAISSGTSQGILSSVAQKVT